MFGIKLIPHTLSFWIRNGFEKLIITSYLGLFLNGIYSFASYSSIIIITFNNVFFNIYGPKIYYKLSKNKNQEIKNDFKYILIGSVIFGILTYIFFITLTILFFDKYQESLKYIHLFIIIALLNTFYSYYALYFFYFKKNNLLSKITFGFSLLHILLISLLTKNIGVYGILYSSILVNLLIIYFMSFYKKTIFK